MIQVLASGTKVKGSQRNTVRPRAFSCFDTLNSTLLKKEALRGLMAPQDQPLPLFRAGCAVFVRLWGLTLTTSIGEAARLTALLDSALLKIGERTENVFPNPYGGAALVQNARDACLAALSLKRRLALEDVSASIGISTGTFERTPFGLKWNAVAPALNMAARLAAWKEGTNQVNVTREVLEEAHQSGMSRDAFGDPRTGKVKDTEFTCWLCHEPAVALTLYPPDSASPINFQANILLLDIEGYSKKTPDEQRLGLAILNDIMVRASAGSEVDFEAQFEPAGDGGYFVFPALGKDSTPHAFDFAHKILTGAQTNKLRIRAGLANGPVASTPHRKAIGGVIFQADENCSRAPVFGLATRDFIWKGLEAPYNQQWVPLEPVQDVRRLLPSVLGKPTSAFYERVRDFIKTQVLVGKVLTSLLVVLGLGLASWVWANWSDREVDIEEAGFVPSGQMGDISALRMDPASSENPHSLPNCERLTYAPTGSSTWVAVAWQFPDGNWGEKPGLNWSSRKYRRLSWWARGVRDSAGNLPKVQFKAGDTTTEGKPYHASFALSPVTFTLTEQWRQYTVDLKGQDLSQVIAAFVVVVRAQDVGPTGATFYLDDIQYR